MKIIVDREQLKTALALPASIVPVRTPKPSLQGVHLEAGDGVLKIMGTDASRGAWTQTDKVDVIDPGVAVIPAERLRSIVSLASAPTVTIEADNDNATIIGDGRSRLNAFPVQDWVNIDKLGGDPVASFDAKDVRKAIGQVRFAAPNSQTQNGSYAMHCIAVQPLGKSKAEFVGADGNKMGAVSVPCRWHGAIEPLLIPIPLVKPLLGMPEDGKVQVYAKAGLLMFDAGEVCIIGPELEAQYPKWRDFMPKEAKATATLDPQEFLECARQAQITTTDESHGARLEWSSEHLRIQTACSHGRTQIDLPLRSYSGDSIAIGVKLDLLAAVIANAGATEVEVRLKGPSVAVIVIGRDFTGAVTPMTLPEAW